jgi:hypothetical protein
MVLFIFALVVATQLFQYLTCPVYRFPDPIPFSGNYWHNPYEGLDSLHWRRANFQIQSYAWGGVTDGRKNANTTIDSLYRMLGYDIVAVSDYQKINKWGSEKESYIPVYEHGYGLLKWHQVLIGARKVNWRDYPFFQTIHHKQHILEVLRRNNELVYIAHPKLREGYQPADFKYLTGYDGIEVLNYMRVSIEHWDSALSAGRYVTIMGNDDAHDVTRPLEIGHRCTYIHSISLDGDSIIAALRGGQAFGADIWRPLDETYEAKAARVPFFAKFKQASITHDTLWVEVSKPAHQFRFIGQGGRIMKLEENTNRSYYVLTPRDTYIRTEIYFYDQNIFYLNPVVRTNGSLPSNPMLSRVDPLRSWVFWVLSWATVAFLVLNIYYLRKRIIRKKNSL